MGIDGAGIPDMDDGASSEAAGCSGIGISGPNAGQSIKELSRESSQDSRRGDIAAGSSWASMREAAGDSGSRSRTGNLTGESTQDSMADSLMDSTGEATRDLTEKSSAGSSAAGDDTSRHLGSGINNSSGTSPAG